MPAQPNSFADILACIWAEGQADDFEKFIHRIESNRKPSNYSQKTNEELIIAAGVFRLCRWEIVIRIILEKLDLRWEQANNRANQVAGSFGPTTLAWLYFLHPDESLMRFFVGVNLELADVSKEMALRTRQQELRQAVMRFHEEDNSSIKALLTAIEQEGKKWAKGKRSTGLFFPYRRADEAADRSQTALLEIQETYIKMGEVGFQKLKDDVVPVPKIVGLPLNQKKEKALDQIRVATLEGDIRLMANTLLPILNGENLPARAYQAFKEHDRKFEAQKRRGKEVTLQTDENQGWVKGATLEKRFGTWKRDEEMQEKLRAVGIIKNDNASKDNVLSLDARRAYEIAEKRYGEKGRRFLDGLKESGQVTAASQRAGISRQMGHKYLIEIRKSLPPRKK